MSRMWSIGLIHLFPGYVSPLNQAEHFYHRPTDDTSARLFLIDSLIIDGFTIFCENGYLDEDRK
jgi:hypothetical protein